MSTIAAKLSYLKNTVDQFEDKSTDLFGEDFIKNATFRELTNKYKNLWTDWPDKVSAKGSNIELQGCNKGKMIIQPKGNTELLLPDEYQQVEYIESTGTQYIDLPFGFDNTDTITLKGSIVSTESDKFMLAPSIWNDKDNRFAMIGVLANNFTIGYGANTTNNTPLLPRAENNENIYTWIYENYEFKLKELSLSIDVKDITFGGTTSNLKLFYGYQSKSQGKIAYYKHTKINGKTYLFIPCYRKSDNVIGMYDTVNDVFYTNAGTGTFLKGEDYQTIKNVTGNNTVKISGKNLLSDNFEDYTIGNPYGCYKIIDNIGSHNLVMSLIDEDTSVDMSGIYFGFSSSGTDASGGVYWIMDNGNEKAKKISTNSMKYFSFYPNNQATFNKIFSRYKIQVEIRNDVNPTDYEPYIEPIEKELNLTGYTLIKDDYITEDCVIHHQGTTETIPEDTTLYNQVKDLYRTIIQVPTIIIKTESEENNAPLIIAATALGKEDGE